MRQSVSARDAWSSEYIVFRWRWLNVPASGCHCCLFVGTGRRKPPASHLYSTLLFSTLSYCTQHKSTLRTIAHSPIAKHTAKEWYILHCTPWQWCRIVHCGGVVHMWLSERSLGCLWQLCYAAFLKETKIRHFLPDEKNKAPCEEKLVATLKDVASTGQDESSLFPTMWAILCSDP